MRRFVFGVTASLALLLLAMRATPATQAVGDSLWAPQECSVSSAGKIMVSFAWTGGSSQAMGQWFELGTSSTWSANSYTDFGPLPPASATSQPVDGLAPQTRYYARVLELMPSGVWNAGPTSVVDTSSCMSSGVVATSGAFDAFITGTLERAHSTSSGVLVTTGDAPPGPSDTTSNGGVVPPPIPSTTPSPGSSSSTTTNNSTTPSTPGSSTTTTNGTPTP